MGYGNRPTPKKRAVMGTAMGMANIDTTGLDPEMYQTLGQEATRRVGASMVQSKNTNPLKGASDIWGQLKGLFKRPK